MTTSNCGHDHGGVECDVKPHKVNGAKSLHNTTANGARKNVKDLRTWGDADVFKLIAKVSSEAEGWMKSTKAMDTGNGVVVQVTTQQRNADGTYSVAEALTFVPGVEVHAQHAPHPEDLGTATVVARRIVPKQSDVALQANDTSAEAENAVLRRALMSVCESIAPHTMVMSTMSSPTPQQLYEHFIAEAMHVCTEACAKARN
jgi:hypothetical protein